MGMKHGYSKARVKAISTRARARMADTAEGDPLTGNYLGKTGWDHNRIPGSKKCLLGMWHHLVTILG